MRYAPGAVLHAGFDRVWKLETVGNSAARGLCGSGLVDALSELRRIGLMEESGAITTSLPSMLRPYLKRDPKGCAVQLTRQVLLWEADIRRLQVAKAAVEAGVQMLLEQSGIKAEDVSKVYLTGGFGAGLRMSSVTAIGMLPKCWEKRVCCLENTSLQGAASLLMQPGFAERLRQLRDMCSSLTLSGNQDFNDKYIEAMRFAEW